MDRERLRHRGWRAAGVCVPVAVLVLGVLLPTAAGQDAAGRNIYEEQLRVQLDRQVAEAREVGVDGGGWFSFAFFHFDDASARTDRTLRQYQLRGWGSANVQGVHRAYVRALMGYDDWNAGQNPDEPHGDQFSGFEVERAWYEFDLGQMLKNETGQRPAVGLRVKVGREFAEIGTGLVLSMPLDMVRFNTYVGDWEFDALLGKTISDTRNIDDSAAVADHHQRCIWGGQLTYTGLTRHRPFAYFLENNDHTRPDPADPAQSYDYSSRYVGLGSRGSLFLPKLRYQAEVVGEFGQTYSAGATDRQDDICAMASDLLLEYLFGGPMKPKVSLEHLWASGDDDRELSATATVRGNRPGTKDHAFNAFGFRDTGLAFSPRVSNLHMYAVGAGFFPLEKCGKMFEGLEVGSKVFLFHKSSTGPLSDTTATESSRWLGWEWDVYCNWRITSDLSWTIRYGAFMPGGAYQDDSCRQFLLTALNLSF